MSALLDHLTPKLDHENEYVSADLIGQANAIVFDIASNAPLTLDEINGGGLLKQYQNDPEAALRRAEEWSRK